MSPSVTPVPVTETLAAFVAGLTRSSVPDAVMDRAKVLMADIVGISIRARHDADSTDSVVNSVIRLGLANGNATVFADARGYTPTAAALINGTLAHSLDFDDTHAPASLHSSAPIVPAALAAAEMVGASGEQTLLGIIAGYEVQIRLALALGPSDHYQRGFHPTATCGVFGAAAAAGRIMGLSAEQIEHAFGAAGSEAAGSMQFLANGSWNKRFHVGHAASDGLLAAVLAEQHYKGSSKALEGAAGFLNSYSSAPDFDKAIAGIGDVWQTLALAVKPYPSCRYTHAAMDGLIALRHEHDIDWRSVQSINVGLPQTGWNIVGGPENVKRHPRNTVDGQFSMPFCAAMAVKEGRLEWDDYNSYVTDKHTLALCQRVTTHVDERAEAQFPENMSATVAIDVTVDDKPQRYESFVVVARGEPDNFVTAEEIRAKFMGLVRPYCDSAQRETLLTALLAFDNADNVTDLMALTRPSSDIEQDDVSATTA